MGRPREYRNPRRTVPIRLLPTLLEQVKRKARRRGISFNKGVEVALKEWVAKSD